MEVQTQFLLLLQLHPFSLRDSGPREISKTKSFPLPLQLDVETFGRKEGMSAEEMAIASCLLKQIITPFSALSVFIGIIHIRTG